MKSLRNTGAGIVLALAVFASAGQAQTAPAWAPVGGYTVNLGLAGPATGPVRSVWYAAAGQRLLAQTETGRVFETTDFQHWKLNDSDPVPAPPQRPAAHAKPEAGIQVAGGASRRYSVTLDNIYTSDDNRLWVNLTGFNGVSVIGDGFTALAVSPANPMEIAVSNQFGVWRSLDGGLSWQSLNESLPNLSARSLAGQRTVVLSTASERLANVTAGTWTLADGASPESLLRSAILAKSGRNSTAVAQSGSLIYAGSADGRVVVSDDDGATWNPASDLSSGTVNRIWADLTNGQAALAAAGGKIFRTTNGGKFWDDVTGTLSAGLIHGITADSSAGVVYVAADGGLFSGRISLNSADQAAPAWKPVGGDLPIAAARDARLNTDNTLTVLLDGYGVWETAAPHRTQMRRILNAADLTERAAAPGSLITILGANVKQATGGQKDYFVLLATDQTSQLQVPFEITPGIQQLAIHSDGAVWTAPLNVKSASPAIFVNADGAPMIQDAESSLVIDANAALRAGSRIQVLATGLGRVSPEWPTGVPAPVDSPPAVVAAVTAFLDGTPIPVTRATLAPTFVGNYLVELQLPTIVNQGANELRIVVNGEESNRVKLLIEPAVAAR